jgi:hypothetical protein
MHCCSIQKQKPLPSNWRAISKTGSSLYSYQHQYFGKLMSDQSIPYATTFIATNFDSLVEKLKKK